MDRLCLTMAGGIRRVHELRHNMFQKCIISLQGSSNVICGVWYLSGVGIIVMVSPFTACTVNRVNIIALGFQSFTHFYPIATS